MVARTSWITARCGTSVSLIRPPSSWELRTVRSCRFPARARSGRSADSSHSRTHAEGAALQLRGVPDGRTRGVHASRAAEAVRSDSMTLRATHRALTVGLLVILGWLQAAGA